MTLYRFYRTADGTTMLARVENDAAVVIRTGPRADWINNRARLAFTICFDLLGHVEPARKAYQAFERDVLPRDPAGFELDAEAVRARLKIILGEEAEAA